MIEFKNIEKKEGKAFWDMLNLLDGETNFMMFEPNERLEKQSYESTLKMIEENKINGNFLFIAKERENIIGFIAAQRGPYKRINHSAYIVIGIRKGYRGKSIGSTFFDNLNNWSIKNKIKRLELTVICKNEIAINLYKKNGFKIEGIKEKSILINNIYEDEYYMSKIY